MAPSVQPGRFTRPIIDPRDPENPIRTILDLVEYNATENPDHVYALQLIKDPRTSGAIDIVEITHRQLKRTILACSERLGQEISRSPDDSADSEEPQRPHAVALLMESDVSLIVHVFALMHLQIPVVLLSARLSPAAIHHLVVETNCSAVIASSGLRSRAEDGLALLDATKPVQLCDQILFESLMAFSKENADDTHLGHTGTHNKTAIIYHSSGTTGMPKPIYHTGQFLLCEATCHALPTIPSGPCFSTLPLFHAFGWVAPCLSLSIGMPACFPPRSTIPNAQATADCLRLAKATSLVTVPSILEDVSASTELTEALRGLSFVTFGGAKLGEVAGQTLASRGVPLVNNFGSTETGPLSPFFVPDADYDWRYFRLRSDIDAELRSVGVDDSGREMFQIIIQPLGWNCRHELQDRLARRQGTSFMYIPVGRADDVIVLANGEKAQPGILESQLLAEPNVKTAVAFGNDQAELGVLLQPAEELTSNDRDAFVDAVWPAIEKANLLLDAHAQVSSKNCILVVPHDKMIPRSDKGSILRKEVYATFAQEIKDLYESLEKVTGKGLGEPLRSERLVEDISNLVHKSSGLRVKAEDSAYDNDLFEMGMDSLQAMHLRRRLQASLAISDESDLRAEQLPRDFVYRFPSIRKMASALQGNTTEDSGFEKLVNQFQLTPANLKAPETSTRASPRASSHAVVVTGATGGLGSHILEHLSGLTTVTSVVCLVRPMEGQNAKERVLKALAKRKIVLRQDALDKICAVECDISESNLGLTAEKYESLLMSVKCIIHAGWLMDFRRQLSAFGSAFQALHNLLTLTKDIDRTHGRGMTAKFLFISSVATAARWREISGEALIPEQGMSPEHAADVGYAKAKLVCEAIIERASNESAGDGSSMRLSAQYVRVGQLSGSAKTGLWNEQEHFPALLKSSQFMGALPKLSGTLSWIPVDIAAQVVCDMVTSEQEGRQVGFNVENPMRQSWADMLDHISKHLGPGSKSAAVPVVPYEEWLVRLRQEGEDDAERCPATKLLTFFEQQFEHMACGSVALDTFHARQVSPTLRKLKEVGEEDVGRYMARWRESGFLQ